MEVGDLFPSITQNGIIFYKTLYIYFFRVNIRVKFVWYLDYGCYQGKLFMKSIEVDLKVGQRDN